MSNEGDKKTRRLALEIAAHCATHYDDTPSKIVVDRVEEVIKAALTDARATAVAETWEKAIEIAKDLDFPADTTAFARYRDTIAALEVAKDGGR